MDHELLENYFENTIIPQLYIDGHLKLRKFTPPAMKHFTLSNNDLGKNVTDLKDNIRYPTFIENIEEVISTGKTLEKEIQTTDMRWFQMNILPYHIRKEKKTDGVIVTFIDITKRIKALKDLEKLNVDHTTFTYAVSHDIRQPLSSLSLLTESMEEAFITNNKNVFRANIEIQKRCISNINKIVEDLSQQGKKKNDVFGNKERVNIEDIWEDITLVLKDEIYQSKARIITHFNSSEILFSRINLRSIVYNLLFNSIKYKDAERPLEIYASTEKTDDFVVLSIADNGIGIDKQFHDKIFKEYIRVNSDGEGIGIGLYLVATMVENNHGKIEVESEAGKGTTFKIYFPKGDG